MSVSRRIDINKAIDVMTEIFGSREEVFETMALILLDQHDITVSEYEQIMESIAVKSKIKTQQKLIGMTATKKGGE